MFLRVVLQKDRNLLGLDKRRGRVRLVLSPQHRYSHQVWTREPGKPGPVLICPAR